jgi:hypothetical protein
MKISQIRSSFKKVTRRLCFWRFLSLISSFGIVPDRCRSDGNWNYSIIADFWRGFLVSMSVNPASCVRLPEETQAFISAIQSTRQHREDLTEILPTILAKVADFVAQAPSLTYSRFGDLGVLKIGHLWVLSPSQLQRWLGISKSRFHKVLQDCLWDQVDPLEADLGPHLAFFSRLPPGEIRKLSFRVGYLAEIDQTDDDACGNNHRTCDSRKWQHFHSIHFQNRPSCQDNFQGMPIIPIMPSEKHIKRDYVYLVNSRSKQSINY